LTVDEIGHARSEAIALAANIDAIDGELFDDPSRSAWLAYRGELLDVLGDVEEGTTVNELRTVFQHVSDEMIAMARRFDPVNDTLYIQYCPMADSNRGAYWLSAEKAIKNPYYGASMLACGEVTGIIE